MNDLKFSKGRIFPVIFMMIITLVFIGITTSIYTITKSRIELNKTINIKKAILLASGINIPQNPKEIEKLYENKVIPIKNNNGKTIYYKVMDKNILKGYVVITSGPGLWGTITVAIGIDKKLKTLTGFELIEQNETPGLGGRITEDWFKKQFKGKRAPLTTVPEGEKTTKSEFQAITGATRTTQAIKDIINNLFQKLPDIIKS